MRRELRAGGAIPLPDWLSPDMAEHVLCYRNSFPYDSRGMFRSLKQEFGCECTLNQLRRFAGMATIAEPGLRVKRRIFNRIPKKRVEFMAGLLLQGLVGAKAVDAYLERFPDQSRGSVLFLIFRVRHSNEEIKLREESKKDTLTTEAKRLSETYYLGFEGLNERLSQLGFNRMKDRLMRLRADGEITLGSDSRFFGAKFSDLAEDINRLEMLGILKDSWATACMKQLVHLETYGETGRELGISKERAGQIFMQSSRILHWFRTLPDADRAALVDSRRNRMNEEPPATVSRFYWFKKFLTRAG